MSTQFVRNNEYELASRKPWGHQAMLGDFTQYNKSKIIQKYKIFNNKIQIVYHIRICPYQENELFTHKA